MAATNDRARFYLEQTVPDLQEYIRKDIFTATEIKSINAQRSSFEHLANSRDATPELYRRYIAYETSLDALRRRRVRRLGVKQPAHSGQRRVFLLHDRAVKKFAGDLGLWKCYIEYAIACKANKKVEELFTRCLRLHPTKHELWVWAASWLFDTQGDMKGARGYMQRGVKFCERDWDVWIEYARLEMKYVDKLVRRRRILGLDEEGVAIHTGNMDAAGAMDDDGMTLPSITAADLDPTLAKDTAETEQELKSLAASPVLAGAIPLAIFDAAMKQFKHDKRSDELAWHMFDAFAEYNQVPCCKAILERVLDAMRRGCKPRSIPMAVCSLKLPCIALSPASPEFPALLGRGLQEVAQLLPDDVESILATAAIKVLLPLQLEPELDPAISKIVTASLKRYIKAAGLVKVAETIRELEHKERPVESNQLLELGRRYFGEVEELQQLMKPGRNRKAQAVLSSLDQSL